MKVRSERCNTTSWFQKVFDLLWVQGKALLGPLEPRCLGAPPRDSAKGMIPLETRDIAGYSAAAAVVDGGSRSIVRKFSSSARKLRAHQSTSSRVMRSTIGFQRARRSAFGM
jgi:hypothetical protein